MQHTLLPTAERKALRREYRIRAAIVLCFALSAAGVIGLVSLFPSFIRATLEERSSTTMLASLKKGTASASASQIQSDLATENVLLGALPSADAIRLSAVISDVVSARGSNSISSLSVTRSGTSTMDILVQGIAPTRDGLLAYESRIQSIAPGTKVDLPIDELAKSANIRFSLRVLETLP